MDADGVVCGGDGCTGCAGCLADADGPPEVARDDVIRRVGHTLGVSPDAIERAQALVARLDAYEAVVCAAAELANSATGLMDGVGYDGGSRVSNELLWKLNDLLEALGG